MSERVATPPPRTSLSAGSLARLFHTPSLIYFVMVAETLSMRETARRLNVASSAIARQIAHLEESLAMPLFFRQARRLSLTPAGEILLRHAKNVTAPLESAVSELDLLAGLKSGNVRIATVESVALTVLPGLIAEFGGRYPRLHVDVSVVVGTEVVDMVVNGAADIGFTFLTHSRRDIEIAIRRDLPIGAVMRPDHPLAGRETLTLDDCFNHACALPKRGLSIRDVMDAFLDSGRQPPRSFVEVNSVRMLLELAKTGRYLSIITPLGIERELASNEIVFRPLAEKGLPFNRFAMTIKSGAGLRFAPAAFFDLAKTYFDTTDDPRLHG